jgi:hypothetical protein
MAKQENAQTKSDRSHHIFPKPSGGWLIKKEGVAKAVKVFPTKGAAIEFARELSRKEGVAIVIHGRDGGVMSTHTYEQVAHSGATPESGFGCARGLIIMPPNFDDPLEEFGESF